MVGMKETYFICVKWHFLLLGFGKLAVGNSIHKKVYFTMKYSQVTEFTAA